MAFVLRSLLLRPIYISYNTCICIWTLVLFYFLCSDFHKAFDIVLTTRFCLSKLNTCGVLGITLDWFSSYLTNREQYVCINNVDSNPRVIQCGVPQRSILGPLLFLIFFKYITKCSNQFINTFFTLMIARFQLVYQVTMLWTLLN